VNLMVKFILFPFLWVDKNVGGQAVIEGVMMRSPSKISTSVRCASGEIVTRVEEFRSFTKRYKQLGRPIIRGIVSFIEMLVVGIKTLNYSAEMAASGQDARENVKGPVSTKMTLALAGALVVSLGLGISIFFFLPLLFAQLLHIHHNALAFNLVAGGFRVVMFVLYIKLISYLKDIQRVFAYHGAEHKSIYAFENELPLTVENAAKFTTLHPRCGTSFILIVALFAIFLFSISDTVFAIAAGHQPGLFQRFGLHFALLPVVAGISFELLKLSGKTRDNKITKIFIAPGLLLQKITTREPDASQLEVALAALKSSIEGTELAPETMAN
jgi:uncharacterized protein YqhQ